MKVKYITLPTSNYKKLEIYIFFNFKLSLNSQNIMLDMNQEYVIYI